MCSMICDYMSVVCLTSAVGSIPTLMTDIAFIVTIQLASFLFLHNVSFTKEGFMNRLLIFVLLIIGCFAQFLSAYLINVMSSNGYSLTLVQFLLAKVKHTNRRHGGA